MFWVILFFSVGGGIGIGFAAWGVADVLRWSVEHRKEHNKVKEKGKR